MPDNDMLTASELLQLIQQFRTVRQALLTAEADPTTTPQAREALYQKKIKLRAWVDHAILTNECPKGWQP